MTGTAAIHILMNLCGRVFGKAPHKACLDNARLMPSLRGRKAYGYMVYDGIREIGNADALTGISEILFTIDDQAIERVEKA